MSPCYERFWVSGRRGKRVRTLAGAFEPIFTMTGTRSGLPIRVSPTLPSGGRGGAPAHGQGRAPGAQGGLATAIQCGSRGGPAVPSTLGSNATRFECWWPAARGNPAPAGRALSELAKRPAQQVPHERALLRCRKGGNAQPSSIAHAPSLRDTQGVTPFVDAGSFVGRRFPSLRVRTVRKGAGPSDGVRLPTRSKPSKGTSAGGDADRVRAVFGR
jgi:hypothetical protein